MHGISVESLCDFVRRRQPGESLKEIYISPDVEIEEAKAKEKKRKDREWNHRTFPTGWIRRRWSSAPCVADSSGQFQIYIIDFFVKMPNGIIANSLWWTTVGCARLSCTCRCGACRLRCPTLWCTSKRRGRAATLPCKWTRCWPKRSSSSSWDPCFLSPIIRRTNLQNDNKKKTKTRFRGNQTNKVTSVLCCVRRQRRRI